MNRDEKLYAKDKKNSLSVDPETRREIAMEKARTGLQMWQIIRFAWHHYREHKANDATRLMRCTVCKSISYAGCEHVKIKVDGENLLTAQREVGNISSLVRRFEVAWETAVDRKDVTSQQICRTVIKLLENIAHAQDRDAGHPGPGGRDETD